MTGKTVNIIKCKLNEICDNKKMINKMEFMNDMTNNDDIKENKSIKTEKENMVKTVDVVIPLYQPGREITDIIDRLIKQTYPVDHIIMINTECGGYDASKIEAYISKIKMNKPVGSSNCTNDKSDNRISGENGFQLSDETDYQTGNSSDKKSNVTDIIIKNIQKKEFNHGLTRNLGMLMSDADYVVFMTQDAIPKNENLIKELIKPFEDEDVYVTYARQMPRENCKYVEKYVRQFNYPDYDIVKTKATFEKYGIKNIFCSDVCAAYRRVEHIKLGGFKKTDFNEDMIYAYDVIMQGKKVCYVSKAKVIHSHNYSYLQQFNRNIQIGRSQKEFDYIFSKLKSENEGIKMLLNGIRYLVKNKKWYYIPDLIISTGFKFVGYQIGKHGRESKKHMK